MILIFLIFMVKSTVKIDITIYPIRYKIIYKYMNILKSLLNLYCQFVSSVGRKIIHSASISYNHQDLICFPILKYFTLLFIYAHTHKTFLSFSSYCTYGPNSNFLFYWLLNSCKIKPFAYLVQHYINSFWLYCRLQMPM